MTDIGYIFKAIDSSKEADKKYVYMTAIKAWLKEHCPKAKGPNRVMFLGKTVLFLLSQQVVEGMLEQWGWGFRFTPVCAALLHRR